MTTIMLAYVSASALLWAQPEPETLVAEGDETVVSESVEKNGNADAMPSSDAELDDIDLLSLEIPVVVSAARHEQTLASVPYAMSVITAEDIRLSGARSIPDALRLVPGVDVADLTYGNSAVSPRGFHGFLARQTLVLVDGRQIFDSFFGGTTWGSWPFQLEDIERIEVIRGPAGVAWGANAVNGVINIITKDPRDQLGLTTTLSGGSRGSQKEHMGYAFGDGKLRMRVSGEFEGSDGFLRGGNLLRGLADEYQAGRIGLHAVYDSTPNDTLTLSAGSAVLDDGFPPALTAGLFPGHARSQANYLLGKWTHRVNDDNTYEFTGYLNDFHVSPGIRSVDYRYQQLAAQFNHSFKLHEHHTLTWGMDSRVDLMDASNSDPQLLSKSTVESGIFGVYLQDEWRFAPKWSLGLSGRLDYDTYGGFQPNARAALSHQVSDDSSIYGAVSRAFQMPPAAFRFTDVPFIDGLAVAVADRELDPQTLIAYEMGYRGRFFDRLDLSVNAFWNQYDELTTLSPQLGPPGLIRLDEANRAAGSLYGVEVDSKYALTKTWSLLAHYTYQQLNWSADVPFTDKDSMTPPKHKAMIGTRYSATDDLHLSAHLYYVDAVTAPNSDNPFAPAHIDPYFRLDLRAEHEFWKDRASLAVGVRNLLDNHHPEGGTLFLSDAEVPRMVFAELRVTLK